MLICDFETRSTLFDDDAVTILGVSDRDGTPQLHAVPGSEALDAQLPLLGVTGAHGELIRALLPVGDRLARVALLGLGAGDGTPSDWRLAVGAGARALSDEASIAIALPEPNAELVEAVATGFSLGAYRFENYLTESTPSTRQLIVVTDNPVEADAALARARVIASAVWLVRDLVNTPPNDLGPAALADLATASVSELGIETEVLDEVALTEGGYGGHIAVGRGSSRPPRLAVLRWRPEDATTHIALVGKGITFDTGGLSLKPAASMVGMKFDMAGAAVVVGVMCAIAQLGIPVAVTGYLCLAENMPSGDATRPDDIIAIRGGTTVEVTNTDAEGRLVMADAIAAASELAPDAIIDIATLTGAQIIALGDRTTGVMGNDDDWIHRITDAAHLVGEPAWHMPIPEEVGKALASDVADIANARPGNRSAGMLSAAHFLRRFVGEGENGPIPWVHLDIAGPSNNERSAYGVTPKGATGVMTRTLVTMIEQLAGDAPRTPAASD